MANFKEFPAFSFQQIKREISRSQFARGYAREVCVDFENPNLFDLYSLADFPKCLMNIRLASA